MPLRRQLTLYIVCSTVSLGKYGSFPSNLILHRPFHTTYEVLDKAPGENFSRLRVVPPGELYEDLLADSGDASVDGSASVISAADGIEYTLVDAESGEVVARSDNEVIDASARQMLTQDEIEVLKKKGSGAGKDIITKLLLSHTALEQKTSFSLAKYKILKNKKYIRRFSVLPLDVLQLSQHFLEKDPFKILELREEMLALVGCWSNAHYAGRRQGEVEPEPVVLNSKGERPDGSLQGGRWLVVDDTGGLLVAAMAERMGILYPDSSSAKPTGDRGGAANPAPTTKTASADAVKPDVSSAGTVPRQETNVPAGGVEQAGVAPPSTKPVVVHRPDLEIPYARTNTITVIHSNSQPNLFALKYWGFDIASSTLHNPVPQRPANPSDPSSSSSAPQQHPLTSHLLTLSWLQLLRPDLDPVYSGDGATEVPDDVLATWKANKRGQYHRRRRRWARTRYIVDQTRAGGFDGLVVATFMDVTDVVRHALPLLRGGAVVAVYSPTVEPLVSLADRFSIARRSAWKAGAAKVGEKRAASAMEEDEEAGAEGGGEGVDGGGGNGTVDGPPDDSEINPLTLIGPMIQTSRARHWQVLPGRTHPVMSARGGAEGYIFTGWRALPLEGAVQSRGKYKRRRVD